MDISQKIKNLFCSISVDENILSPSEYAEKKRYLTSDVSTVQGKFKYDLTPYMREIVDCLSPHHPAKIVGFMKNAQCGATEGLIVNGLIWTIANNPGNILMLSANDDLSKEMVESRLDQGIASCGIQHLIRPNTLRKRNNRTGDTSKSKEFAGGRAFFGGYNSINKLVRQRSIRIGIFDDWSAAPRIDKEEGHLFTLIQKRFNTAKHTMKQFYISTPKTKPDNTYDVFLMGDQREWRVPCPCCGAYIALKWYTKERGYGIHFEKDDKGNLIEDSVGYICQECGEKFKEKHKYDMNRQGKWVPTAEPSRPGFYSYHLPGFYGAPHMLGWTDFAYEWLEIYKNGNESVSKLKAFINQILGEPWEERKQEIKRNILMKNTRPYEIGTIPDKLSQDDGNGNIVLLTCACDLNGTIDDARMDFEVWAHSESGSIYSIKHGSIGTYGSKDNERGKWTYRNNEPNNVWDFFYNEVINVSYKKDSEGEMRILMVGVDSGYYTHYAYAFTDQYPGFVVAVRGKGEDKYLKPGVDLPYFKPGRERNNLYILEVDVIKDDISEMIGLRWLEGQPQPHGFINFPIAGDGLYSHKYFEQYENETKEIESNEDGEPIGWKWKRKYSTAPNHYFDTLVYNLAIKEIIVQKICKELKIKDGTWSDYVGIVKGII